MRMTLAAVLSASFSAGSRGEDTRTALWHWTTPLCTARCTATGIAARTGAAAVLGPAAGRFTSLGGADPNPLPLSRSPRTRVMPAGQAGVGWPLRPGTPAETTDQVGRCSWLEHAAFFQELPADALFD